MSVNATHFVFRTLSLNSGEYHYGEYVMQQDSHFSKMLFLIPQGFDIIKESDNLFTIIIQSL